jgi:DNA-binding FadR family transcriptional regulator
LADVLLRLHALSFRIWHVVLDRIGCVRNALEQHIAIAEAIEAKDGDLAETLVRQHVAEFQQQIKAAL